MTLRPAAVLAIVVALVAALAVLAAVVSAGRERPALDASTPGGVVQLFLTALFDDDVAEAVEYLDPALGCSDSLPEVYLPEAVRIAVITSTTSDDTARVELQVEEGSWLDGQFSHREDYTLERLSGGWVITGEPWPVYGCT